MADEPIDNNNNNSTPETPKATPKKGRPKGSKNTKETFSKSSREDIARIAETLQRLNQESSKTLKDQTHELKSFLGKLINNLDFLINITKFHITTSQMILDRSIKLYDYLEKYLEHGQYPILEEIHKSVDNIDHTLKNLHYDFVDLLSNLLKTINQNSTQSYFNNQTQGQGQNNSQRIQQVNITAQRVIIQGQNNNKSGGIFSALFGGIFALFTKRANFLTGQIGGTITKGIKIMSVLSPFFRLTKILFSVVGGIAILFASGLPELLKESEKLGLKGSDAGVFIVKNMAIIIKKFLISFGKELIKSIGELLTFVGEVIWKLGIDQFGKETMDDIEARFVNFKKILGKLYRGTVFVIDKVSNVLSFVWSNMKKVGNFIGKYLNNFRFLFDFDQSTMKDEHTKEIEKLRNKLLDKNNILSEKEKKSIQDEIKWREQQIKDIDTLQKEREKMSWGEWILSSLKLFIVNIGRTVKETVSFTAEQIDDALGISKAKNDIISYVDNLWKSIVNSIKDALKTIKDNVTDNIFTRTIDSLFSSDKTEEKNKPEKTEKIYNNLSDFVKSDADDKLLEIINRKQNIIVQDRPVKNNENNAFKLKQLMTANETKQSKNESRGATVVIDNGQNKTNNIINNSTIMNVPVTPPHDFIFSARKGLSFR